MAQPALRLLHASDFHLERPPYGLANIPENLKETLLEAPYQAAEQVFETALSESADALLLAGDIVDVARAGPRAIVFLVEQFGRLADRGIEVYWAGGKIDPPEAWPPSVPLPDNVHYFPVGNVETFELTRDGKKIAHIQGISREADGSASTHGFHCDAHGLFTVGVAYGTDDAAGREGDRVHYMALGGKHQHETVDREPGLAHYCGTPQGRGPREVGPHGCTLVQVDDAGKARTRFIATDTVRWIFETMEITASTREEQLEERLQERIEKLLAKHRGVDLLVRWNVRGTGKLIHRLRPGGLSDELLVRLQRRYGNHHPAVWSVSINSESPLSVPVEWYDQETVLGDLLRQFRDLEGDTEADLDLGQFVPAAVRGESWAAFTRIGSGADRAYLLQQASKVGVDMLSLPLDEEPEE